MRIYHHGRPYGTPTTRLRPHDSGAASRDPAESREHSQACRTLPSQSQDGRQGEEADACARCADGPDAAALHHVDAGARSAGCRVSQAHTAPAGGLCVCIAGDAPTPHTLRAAAWPETSWHEPLAGDDRRQTTEEAI